MRVKLTKTISYKNYFTNIVILILSAFIKILVMASNIIILAFKNHNFELKSMIYNYYLNKYLKYITPIIIYILRDNCFLLINYFNYVFILNLKQKILI